MIQQYTALTNSINATGFESWKAAGRTVSMRLDPQERTAGPIPVFGTMVKDNVTAVQSYAPSSLSGENKPDIQVKTEEEDFNFGDVIDMVNPLQQLPVIGTIYRSLTGDVIKPISTIIGGAIFGGPIGAVSGTVNAIVENRTGRDIGGNALALMGFDIGKGAEKPVIDYAVGDNITAAHNAYTKAGQKNFAATQASVLSWNG
jgi:hypothetical protein